MSEIEVNAHPANIAAAQTFYNLFTMNLYDRGWMAALHGSCIANSMPAIDQVDGEVKIKFQPCRDIDFILVPVQPAPGHEQLTIDELRQYLIEKMQFIPSVEKERGALLGWVGTMHTYVIDITVVQP